MYFVLNSIKPWCLCKCFCSKGCPINLHNAFEIIINLNKKNKKIIIKNRSKVWRKPLKITINKSSNIDEIYVAFYDKIKPVAKPISTFLSIHPIQNDDQKKKINPKIQHLLFQSKNENEKLSSNRSCNRSG